MDKSELIWLTLEKLHSRFKSQPECFQLHYDQFYSSDNFTIIWRPMIEIEPNDIINDPNCEGAIVIKAISGPKEINCKIFLSTKDGINTALADSEIHIRTNFFCFNKNFRKLNKLKKLIIKRDLNSEGRRYLNKLSCVFPDIIDAYILKK